MAASALANAIVEAWLLYDNPKLVFYYHYNHFTAPWTFSRTTRVSQYQEGKTNLDLLQQEIVSGSGIAGPYADLHLTPDR